MNIKELYDSVNGVTPISQPRFIECANRALQMLSARFGYQYTFTDGNPDKIASVEDNVPVYDEWADFIISYCCGENGNESMKNRADLNSDYTYRTIWKKKIEGNRIKVKSWGWGGL